MLMKHAVNTGFTQCMHYKSSILAGTVAHTGFTYEASTVCEYTKQHNEIIFNIELHDGGKHVSDRAMNIGVPCVWPEI